MWRVIIRLEIMATDFHISLNPVLTGQNKGLASNNHISHIFGFEVRSRELVVNQCCLLASLWAWVWSQ